MRFGGCSTRGWVCGLGSTRPQHQAAHHCRCHLVIPIPLLPAGEPNSSWWWGRLLQRPGSACKVRGTSSWCSSPPGAPAAALQCATGCMLPGGTPGTGNSTRSKPESTQLCNLMQSPRLDASSHAHLRQWHSVGGLMPERLMQADSMVRWGDAGAHQPLCSSLDQLGFFWCVSDCATSLLATWSACRWASGWGPLLHPDGGPIPHHHDPQPRAVCVNRSPLVSILRAARASVERELRSARH